MIALTQKPNISVLVLSAIDILKVGMIAAFCKKSLELMEEDDSDYITVGKEDLCNLINIHNKIFVSLAKSCMDADEDNYNEEQSNDVNGDE